MSVCGPCLFECEFSFKILVCIILGISIINDAHNLTYSGRRCSAWVYAFKKSLLPINRNTSRLIYYRISLIIELVLTTDL